jgi:radical SAM protein with 4Fe4S-binding SPASM domain
MIKKIKKMIYSVAANIYLRKPDQKQFLETRYPTFGSIYKVALNQIFYIFKSTYSPKITSIQFEVTNNCNLKCKMCPVNNGMKRKKGFMDFNLFKKIIDENLEMGFALLFNWGEPLLHPKIFEMLEYAKNKGIRTFITTNATLLDTDEKMIKLLKTKIERITISLDGFEDSYTKIRGFDYKKIEKRILRLIELRNQLNVKTKIDINMVIMPETEKFVPGFYKKWGKLIDRIQIQPNILFTRKQRKSRCKELWRGNLIILWDGKVVPCCVDYEGKMILGDANKERLSNVWNSHQARKLRKLHNTKEFHPVCETCNEYLTPYIKPRFN